MSYVKILLVCFILLPSTFSLVCVPRGEDSPTGGGGRPHGGAVAPSASPPAHGLPHQTITFEKPSC